MSKTLALSAALLAAALLSACGGGHSSPPPPMPDANEVPASASASTAAYVSYTGSLAASETQEGLDVSKTVPPTSETDEPIPVS